MYISLLTHIIENILITHLRAVLSFNCSSFFRRMLMMLSWWVIQMHCLLLDRPPEGLLGVVRGCCTPVKCMVWILSRDYLIRGSSNPRVFRFSILRLRPVALATVTSVPSDFFFQLGRLFLRQGEPCMGLTLVMEEFLFGRTPIDLVSFCLTRVSLTLNGVGLVGVFLPLCSPYLNLITLMDLLLREGGLCLSLSLGVEIFFWVCPSMIFLNSLCFWVLGLGGVAILIVSSNSFCSQKQSSVLRGSICMRCLFVFMMVTSSSSAFDSDLKVAIEGGEGISWVISLSRVILVGTDPLLDISLREL